MDIKGYLNEKLKNNKVAEKAKKLTATALVAGTILTGAGLTACDKTSDMSNDELASGIVDILQGQNEELELNNIIFGGIDNQYIMIASNSDITEYVGYEITKLQFDNLMEMAQKSNSDYIQVSPNGDSFVITEGGINDENLKEFNEIIYSVISKGNTIDVSKYIQSSNNNPNNNGNNGSHIEVELPDMDAVQFGIIKNIFDYDTEYKFDEFYPDYFLVRQQTELTKQDGNETVSNGIVDFFQIIDVCSKEDNQDPNTKKVMTFVFNGDFDMDNFVSILESKVDNDKIKKVKNGYLVDYNVLKDEKMSDLNNKLKEIVNGSATFLYDFSYVAPLEQGEFDQETEQEETEQQR